MKKKFFIETYGCQMNFADSEILSAILGENGYELCTDYKQSDLILVNTCSIRDHAEQRVFNRLLEFAAMKKNKVSLKIGMVGCMAERIKEDLLEKNIGVDLVVGPDAYRDLPRLLTLVENGQKGINVLLSEEETYYDIEPVRLSSNGVSAFISIMRGCQNFCAYCVVPYTRGKERSRPMESILKEANDLFEKGYREITLLGQNVNSYHYQEIRFPQLMEAVAKINPLLRIRFATSHPKDLSDELLMIMQKYPNICRSIHLPVQSGSNRMLDKMKRKYTREIYLERIASIKKYLPEASLSSDIIAGFCDETEEDHQDTLSLMREVAYEYAFMFKYSERPGTFAAKNYPDNISEEIKLRRLNEIIDLQQSMSLHSNEKDVGKEFEILVEGVSKKSASQYFGRTSQNKVLVFENTGENFVSIGEYARVRVLRCTAATLIGEKVL